RGDCVAEGDTGRRALDASAVVYESPEAEATMRVAVDSAGVLAVSRLSAPGGSWRLRPLYRDGFAMPAGVLVFSRDAKRQVNGFQFTTSRVRNLKFERRP